MHDTLHVLLHRSNFLSQIWFLHLMLREPYLVHAVLGLHDHCMTKFWYMYLSDSSAFSLPYPFLPLGELGLVNFRFGHGSWVFGFIPPSMFILACFFHSHLGLVCWMCCSHTSKIRSHSQLLCVSFQMTLLLCTVYISGCFRYALLCICHWL